jgi:hypothetical protein
MTPPVKDPRLPLPSNRSIPVTEASGFAADMGVRHERLEGPAYEEIIDEFMEAVFSRWPNVIVQVKKGRRFSPSRP